MSFLSSFTINGELISIKSYLLNEKKSHNTASFMCFSIILACSHFFTPVQDFIEITYPNVKVTILCEICPT